MTCEDALSGILRHPVVCLSITSESCDLYAYTDDIDCVAVCCRELQCVKVCCRLCDSVLQCVAYRSQLPDILVKGQVQYRVAWDALSSQVIFRKWALKLVALLRKMTCNLRHPMGLRHPVVSFVGLFPCIQVSFDTNKPLLIIKRFDTKKSLLTLKKSGLMTLGCNPKVH